MPNIIAIPSLDHPDVLPYARLTEAQLRNRLEPDKGIFIAESPKVIAVALDAGYEPLSLLTEESHLDTLAAAMKDWKLDIAGFVGFERSVITAGGISTAEVIAKTLESKKQPGLYFCGEVLDMDADTGGYNLQLAFATGALAGLNAAKSLPSVD